MAVIHPPHPYTTGNVIIGGNGGGAGTISIAGGGAGQVYVSNGTGTATWANPNANTKISGKLNLEGEGADIVINGSSFKAILSDIQSRLAILEPKPELLEKYENLREAYEHYKTLEALLYDDQKPNK